MIHLRAFAADESSSSSVDAPCLVAHTASPAVLFLQQAEGRQSHAPANYWMDSRRGLEFDGHASVRFCAPFVGGSKPLVGRSEFRPSRLGLLRTPLRRLASSARPIDRRPSLNA